MLSRLRFFARLALSALSRSLGITALCVVTIGLALAVLASFAVIVDNLRRVVDEIGREVEISAYLEGGTTVAQAQETAAQLRALPEVVEVRFVSSAEAMIDFKRTLGKDAILLEGLPDEVLPPALEVRLNSRGWTAAQVSAVAERARSLPRVADVRFGQEDIERVSALLGFTRVAALVMGVALCLATIVIISNTIRLTVYARKDEIEIMSLVGATNAFVRAPFVLEGAIQGLLGGGLAAGAIVLLEGALRMGLERGLSYAYGPMQVDFVPARFVGYLIAAGVGLGLVGSVLAVGRFLRV